MFYKTESSGYKTLGIRYKSKDMEAKSPRMGYKILRLLAKTPDTCYKNR